MNAARIRTGPGVAKDSPMPVANCADVSQPVSVTVSLSTTGSAASPPPKASAPIRRNRAISSGIARHPTDDDADRARHPYDQRGVDEQSGDERSKQHDHAQKGTRVAAR